MTTPVTLHLPGATKDAKDAAEHEPDPSPVKGEGGPGSQGAIPGLVNGKSGSTRTAIDFVPWLSEFRVWSADVAKAIKDHPRYIQQIDTALTRIAESSISKTLKKSLGEDLTAVRKSLTDLLAERVSAEKRAAAISTINAAPALIKAAEDSAGEAEKQQRDEAEKARLEALAKQKKEEEDARAAEEQKKQAEAAEAKKKEDEAAQAKAAADKKKEEEAAAAKAEEEKARAEAEAKKKAEEAEAERKAQEAAAVLKKQEEEAAAALKKQQAEQAALDRKNAFGDREGAQAASHQVATETAAADFHARVEEAEGAHAEAVKKLPAKPKLKAGKKPNKGQQQTIDDRKAKKGVLQATLETAKTDAKSAEEAQTAKLLDQFASVAKSPSGKQLNDTDLSWVITASGGKVALAQNLADIAALSSMGLAKTVAAHKDGATIVNVCIDLLTAKFPAEHVIAAALVMRQSAAVLKPWLLALVTNGADVGEALEFAEDFPGAAAVVVKVHPVLGTGSAARDFVESMVKVKAAATDIDWLLTLSDGSAAFGSLCRTIRNSEVSVAPVRAFHQAAGAGFTLAEVAKLVEANRTRLPRATVAIALADAHTPSFVTLLCDMGGTPSAEMKAALRAEALLRDAATAPVGFAAATIKKPKPYTGGPQHSAENLANGAQTGFIRLTFPTGPTFEVHTHWNSKNKSVGAISSMHVQDANGSNGAELEKWPIYFTKLPQAVVDAHNAAQQAWQPAGGPLRLP